MTDNNNKAKQAIELTKRDSLGGNNQPDVTTGNLSHSNDSATVNVVHLTAKDVYLSIPENFRVAVVPQNQVQSAEASATPITLHLDEASSSTANVDNSYHGTISFLLDRAKSGKSRGEALPTICKVSRVLRDLSESSFTPQLVSIGPIHRKDKKLQEFEWLKGRYLHELLNRYRCDSTDKDDRMFKKLEECLSRVNAKMGEIKKFYGGMIGTYNEFELARMMVMDGCFILEFCYKHDIENENLPNKMQNRRIAMDLLLLENQVPFSVLQALFECTIWELTNYRTLGSVLDKNLARYIKLFRSEISNTDVGSEHDHVLGYMHKRYQRTVDMSPNLNTYTTFHSIVELDRSGMNFKPHQEGGWSMAFKFKSSLFSYLPWIRSKATLLMPTLLIEDSTELILRNLIAYEQSFPNQGYCFTSYAHAMDMLIDTQEDIAKLVKSKVLVNTLGSNQEAADMINKVCKNISVSEFYYEEEFKQIDEHYNAFWAKHMALLRRVYFNNPWNIFALLAAVFLFSFTLVQTIYAIKGK